jgi:hypothetical protein
VKLISNNLNFLKSIFKFSLKISNPKKMKIIFLIIVNFFLNLKAISLQYDCNEHTNEMKMYAYYEDRFDKNSNVTFSFFTNFNQFKDLILDCNETYNITNYVAVLPTRSLIINEDFEFKKIFNQNQIDSIVYLNIANINGIDLNSKSFILSSNRFKIKVNVNMIF